jgi:hypothetical protein
MKFSHKAAHESGDADCDHGVEHHDLESPAQSGFLLHQVIVHQLARVLL